MDWSIGSIFLTVIIGWWWYFNICQRKKKIDMIDSTMRKNYLIPKGSMGWPIIGETLEFITCGYASKSLSFMQKRQSRYGKVFKSHLLGRRIIISTDPEVNKIVLQNDGRTFIPFYPKSVMDLLGKTSILRMNGDLHKRLHGLIGGFLKSPLLKEHITKDIEKSMMLSFMNWKDKERIYIQDETKEITFEVLIRILLGIGPGEEMQIFKREFREFIKAVVCLPIKLPGTRMYKSLKAKERMLKMIKKIIESKMQSSEHRAVTDVADAFLKEMNGATDLQRMTIDSICGNIIEMMIPGEDSVPTLITLAIKYLSDSPSALKLLLEENMELKRKKMCSGECYAWTDYMSLPFTQNVINETLRMGNIVNAIWRKACEDVKIKSYLIPKGWCVLASFTSIHLDEENYEKPLEFDAWRWQREKSSQRTFTPFGGGQRLCPGMDFARLEVAIFLHHFVTTFSWVAEEDTIITFPTVKLKKRLPITVSPIATY